MVPASSNILAALPYDSACARSWSWCCVIGGWLGWTVRSAHIQREAVAAIRLAGGSVRYHWDKRHARNASLFAKPWWPKWLVNQLGVDYFGHAA